MTTSKSIPQVLKFCLTSEQVRAARMLLRWEQKDLAEASGISLPSIKRLETQPGHLSAQERTIEAIGRALEKAGVEFIAENGGGAGVRLAKRAKKK
jgi:predicted transcriptional regulator